MKQDSVSGSFARRVRLGTAVVGAVAGGMIMGALGVFNVAVAQQPSNAVVPPAQARAYEFDISPQPLTSALTDLAEQSGIKLAYSSELTKGLSAKPLKGRMSVRDALGRILAGTGLTYHFAGSDTVVIEKALSGGAKLLGPVRVQGVGTENAVAGVNGSTDPTATEGTKSYTSSALSIASKTPRSIRETPQSVSVITQQRMQDQNLTDFTSVMNQATGVTLVAGSSASNSSLATTFYSRGFALTSIQIDGGAPLLADGNVYSVAPVIDMAMYDHVEILRGADGLFNGYGDPSGSVDLTRKRPLDHSQVVVEGEAGSWDDYRTVIDATAPLGFDGRLRGRAVLSYQDQDYFYDTAKNNHTLAYGILEGDLTATTVMRAGFSYTTQNAVPWYFGLPRYENGDDLHLPRSTCLCFDWNRWSSQTKEVFSQLEQQFGAAWSAKVNLTRLDQSTREKYGYVSGTVDPVTAAGPIVNGYANAYSSVQTVADVTVNGSFDLFGHRQQIVFGGNYQDVDGGGYKSSRSLYSYPGPAVDVFGFNPSSPLFAEPASLPPSTYYPEYGQKQWGAYTTLRLTLLDPLHFISGLRYSSYESIQHEQRLNPTNGAVQTDYAPYSYKGHDFSWPPNYSLVYDITKSASVYASYTDIYISQATDLDESGKPIGPVTGSNVELGLKLEGLGGRLNATLAAYRIRQKNYAEFIGYGNYGDTYGDTGDGIHYCCYSDDSNRVNLSQGVDAEVTGEVLRGWQMFAGYTFNLNKHEGSDSEGSLGTPLISLSPKHLLKLWTSYQLQGDEWLHRLNVGGGVNAQTASYNSGSACVKYTTATNGNLVCDYANGGDVPYNYTQGFYAVFSARAAYQIDPRWNVSLNVNNLFDRSYYQTMGMSSGLNWYGTPRNFLLTVRGSF